MTATPSLTVFGHYISQPSRAVLWALAMTRTPFQFVKMDPTKGECESAQFLQKFPAGVIPALEVLHPAVPLHTTTVAVETVPPLRITESSAILKYLALTRGWEDWYPPGDLEQQARIDSWLHWNNSNTRLATTAVFRHLLRNMDLGMATTSTGGAVTASEEEVIRARRAKVASTVSAGLVQLLDPLKVLEGELSARAATARLSGLHAGRRQVDKSSRGPLVTGEGSSPSRDLSLADIAIYCELDQLERVGLLFPSADDLSGWQSALKPPPESNHVSTPIATTTDFPFLRQWMTAVSAAPEHDAVRASMFKLAPVLKGVLLPGR